MEPLLHVWCGSFFSEACVAAWAAWKPETRVYGSYRGKWVGLSVGEDTPPQPAAPARHATIGWNGEVFEATTFPDTDDGWASIYEGEISVERAALTDWSTV